MPLTNNEMALLDLVNTFSGLRRYSGVMPGRLLHIWNEGEVQDVLEKEYAAMKSVKVNDFYEIQGVALTEKGRRALLTK